MCLPCLSLSGINHRLSTFRSICFQLSLLISITCLNLSLYLG
nr:MAG TPA: hypothetical protein [Caudoviricetes sp.]